MKPSAAYRRLFIETIAGTSAETLSEERLAKLDAMMQSQLLWDKTMARSIHEQRLQGRRVVHINGKFHSDYHLGIPEQVGLSPLFFRSGMIHVMLAAIS